MKPVDYAAIWEDWGCRSASRLKFGAPQGTAGRWLNQRNDIVGTHPVVVRLEGPGAVLDSLEAALKLRWAAREGGDPGARPGA
mmetsp:Transcript_86375/g.244843  ORF Transcript_86375/g.244843 Transcript_86375/m.244843 type:complete len:83 (+) Transcript_86375:2-250(+)